MLSTQAVSPPYTHGIQKVTAGIVIEIPPAVRRYAKLEKNYQFLKLRNKDLIITIKLVYS